MLACFQTKRKREAIKTLRDGRQVCDLKTAEGRREYKLRTKGLNERQRFRCAICLHPNLGMEFDHEAGRGSNGSHRDDRILDESGNWINAALCWQCNTWKGSKRYCWHKGEYVPAVEKYAGKLKNKGAA